jgi:hypothetical protein
LQETLAEEEHANSKLSEVAEGEVNRAALNSAESAKASV